MTETHFSSPFSHETYEEQAQAFQRWQNENRNVSGTGSEFSRAGEPKSLQPVQIPRPVLEADAKDFLSRSYAPFRHAELDRLKEKHKAALQTARNWQTVSDFKNQTKQNEQS